jgi:hypothetical protein
VTDHDVIDYDPGVNEILDKQVPLRLDAQSDWAGALRKAEGAPESGRNHNPTGRLGEWVAVRMRSRRLLAPAFLAGVLVIAGAAGGARFWSGPSPAEIDTTHATSLVEYALTADFSTWKAGDRIALWHLPQPDGSTCVFTALASPKPTAPGTDDPNPLGGGSCGNPGGQGPPGKPMTLQLETGIDSGLYYNYLISGSVSSGSDIARLEIRSDDGSSVPLAYSHGWFLGQLELPPPSSSASLPHRGSYVVVGYDSQGKAIERRDLAWALNPAP